MRDFVIEYRALGDDEILRIAGDREDLVDEARQAIEMELQRRGLTTNDLEQYQAHIEKAEMQEQVGKLPFLFPYGIGKRLFGKAAHVISQGSIWEEFDTTLWIIVFWVPLVPVTTYRIRRRVRGISLFGPWQSYNFTVISRRARDWRLILKTWAWFGFAVLVLASVLKFISRL